jgi:VWFA-related protein
MKLIRNAGSAAVVLAGLAVATDFPGAQAPEVTFKVEVNYVEEDVRVVDRTGNFVRGLRQDAFQVFEDGKSQRIQTFGVVDMPITPRRNPRYMASDAPTIESDVADNKQVLDGRLYLIVMDDYHVAPLRTQNAKALARRFVLEKLGPHDQAAVVVTSGALNGSQEFTPNRRLLLDAIGNFVGQKVPSAAVDRMTRRAREESRERSRRRSGDDPEPPVTGYTEDADAPERTFKARAALNSLRTIAEWMAAIQGRRKAIIYISEGIDYNLYDIFVGADRTVFQFETFNLIEQETWDTISAASRSNVQIYPIDPRGLTAMAQELIEVQGQPMGGLNLGTNTLMQELHTSQMNLRQLAEETGGVAAVGSGDLTRALDRIVEENSAYYVLGYYSSNERRDGKLRSISVKVAGYPDAQVTYRKRYAAPRGRVPRNTARTPANPAAGLTAELMQAMATPLPRTGLQLRLTAVPRKGLDGAADLDVLIETSGKDLTFSRNGELFVNMLSLSVGVFTKEGKPVISERPDASLRLRAENHARVAEHGVRILVPLRIQPGRYQLRVAAQDSSKARQGTAHLDLDIPDFTRDALALSGIAVSATADRSMYIPPRPGFDPFNGLLPGALSTLREIPAGSEVPVYVEVYDNQPSPAHRIDISTTVRTDDGRVMFTDSEERSSEELHGTPGAFGYSTRIPVTAWSPGRYTLTIEAKSGVGNSSPVSRIIEFQVK